MRNVTAIAALVLSAAATPAAAMTPGQAKCPASLAPAGLAATATENVLNFDEAVGTDPKLEAALDQLAKACFAREHVTKDKQNDYTRYVSTALIYAELKRRLGVKSISTKVIDDAFDIGPGRRNPKSADLDDVAFNKALAKMKQGGVDIKKLSDQALSELGTYVVSAGDMYRLAAIL